MITKDFSEFPEHRTGFYNMLRAINQHCFQGNETASSIRATY
jgi:exportin-1